MPGQFEGELLKIIVRRRGEIICKTVVGGQWSVVRGVVRKVSGRACGMGLVVCQPPAVGLTLAKEKQPSGVKTPLSEWRRIAGVETPACRSRPTNLAAKFSSEGAGRMGQPLASEDAITSEDFMVVYKLQSPQ